MVSFSLLCLIISLTFKDPVGNAVMSIRSVTSSHCSWTSLPEALHQLFVSILSPVNDILAVLNQQKIEEAPHATVDLAAASVRSGHGSDRTTEHGLTFLSSIMFLSFRKHELQLRIEHLSCLLARIAIYFSAKTEATTRKP